MLQRLSHQYQTDQQHKVSRSQHQLDYTSLLGMAQSSSCRSMHLHHSDLKNKEKELPQRV
jgi:hypothetical protein